MKIVLKAHGDPSHIQQEPQAPLHCQRVLSFWDTKRKQTNRILVAALTEASCTETGHIPAGQACCCWNVLVNNCSKITTINFANQSALYPPLLSGSSAVREVAGLVETHRAESPGAVSAGSTKTSWITGGKAPALMPVLTFA